MLEEIENMRTDEILSEVEMSKQHLRLRAGLNRRKSDEILKMRRTGSQGRRAWCFAGRGSGQRQRKRAAGRSQVPQIPMTRHRPGRTRQAARMVEGCR